MSPTLWLLLTAGGWALLWVMKYVGKPTGQALLVRAAAFAFIGAGTIGASGWIGQTLRGLLDTANTTGNQATSAAVGAGAIWIVWMFLAGAWLLCLLPESWFGRDIPDWLSISGLILPSLSSAIPGPVGDFFTTVFTTIGSAMANGARGLIT